MATMMVDGGGPSRMPEGGTARTVSRRLLRHEIRRELLASLLSGRLSAGAHITEAQLASELGVSRTPLREALFGLERDGFFENRNGKGLTVRALTLNEVRQIYPILSALEGLALRSVKEFPSVALMQLDALVADIEQKTIEKDYERAFELDSEWTNLLMSPCENEQLLHEISRHRDRALRYELAYVRSLGTFPKKLGVYRDVAGHIREGSMTDAVHAMDALRRDTVVTLADWLR